MFSLSASEKVHPRSRGEYLPRPWSIGLNPGSSPLTRGILDVSKRHGVSTGFIPAHAGNTSRKKEMAELAEVHPRSRGEYALFLLAVLPQPGSSPLTRGIPDGKYYVPDWARFIPAHAGNTIYYCWKIIAYQVHPRSRGEYIKHLALLLS